MKIIVGKNQKIRLLTILMALGVSASVLRADDMKSGVDFETHILPIFQKSCLDCHSNAMRGKGKKPKKLPGRIMKHDAG